MHRSADAQRALDFVIDTLKRIALETSRLAAPADNVESRP